MGRGSGVAGTLAALVALVCCSTANAARTSEDFRVKTSDGVELKVTVSGEAPLTARPTLVEFSPYGPASETHVPPPSYNNVLVQIRGTGASDGEFDALGPRTQQDVHDVLAWACGQPWSDGNLAVNGFSASAITIYNSLHLELPCVKAMLLKSGTRELYRDLLVPGGVNNIAPGAAVIVGIGGITLSQGFEHFSRDPLSALGLTRAFVEAGLNDLTRPTLDSWWRERGMRGNVNDIPALVIDGFFDVESRGAFEGYTALREDGAHMIVVGAHDGAPVGTDAGVGKMNAWLDRYLRGVDNGVEREPRVQLLMSDGDREDYLDGQFVTASGDDWPLPGTRWEALALGQRSLGFEAPAQEALQPYVTVPSLPTATDVPTTATIGPAGFNALAKAFPFLTEMNGPGALGLSYTTAPLASDVVAAGPLNLELPVSSTAPETAIWAVVSDVDPEGRAHPLAVGRLSNAFPDVIDSESRHDPETGDVVQPYGDYTNRRPARPGEERKLSVEFWPIGNRFRAGHSIRLDVVGAAATSLPGIPAINTVRTGGNSGARLLFPVAPGSDLRGALAP
jgi:predicted acyl esterase